MGTSEDKWRKLYASQRFDECSLDYSVVTRHCQLLDYLSAAGKSAAFIFDLFRQQYIYASPNFNELLGTDLRELLLPEGGQITDRLLHPEDNYQFEQIQLYLYSFLFSLPASRKTDYKHVYTFRVLSGQHKYIRFVSQQQVLELDKRGNIWLVMGIIDLAPNQDPNQEFEFSVLNYKTGERLSASDFIADTVKLTKRETEVLQLIKEGLLSKEISDKLSISLHTVNIHRQNILQKTNTNNAIEALNYARKFGLLA